MLFCPVAFQIMPLVYTVLRVQVHVDAPFSASITQAVLARVWFESQAEPLTPVGDIVINGLPVDF